MSGIAFQNVGGLKPHRTRFDWQFSKKFNTDFGWIVPIFTQFCLPGDYYNINLSILGRCLPLSAPVIHRCQFKADFVFIPKRLIDDCNSRPGCGNPFGDPLILKDQQPKPNRFNWELFITGGFDGNDAQTHPRWYPTNAKDHNNPVESDGSPQKWDTTNPNPSGFGLFTLWDYLQYPVTPVTNPTGGNPGANNVGWENPITPTDDLRRCYNLYFNEFFRDETIWMTEWEDGSVIPSGTYTVLPWHNEQIQFSAWLKDYFTSSLPFQQRGISPALPLSGNLALDFSNSMITSSSYTGNVMGFTTDGIGVALGNAGGTGNDPVTNISYVQNSDAILNALNKGTVNLNNGLTYDIADFRLTFQIQKWLERNARAGVRYNEWTYAHWGKHIGDARLWRPEYIGGLRCPLIFSEILQTSQTATTTQGTMTGHGITVNGSHIGTYECNEYGYIMGVLRVMPDPAYASQGFKRWNLYETKYDFPQAEFVNLSEQDITSAEIWIDPTDSSTPTLHGYQGIYDEHRTQEDQVCGEFRTSLSFWHMNRIFANKPQLNRDFIECNKDRAMRRIFFEQTSPGILVDCEFNVSAVRPIPAIAEPGLIDHH